MDAIAKINMHLFSKPEVELHRVNMSQDITCLRIENMNIAFTLFFMTQGVAIETLEEITNCLKQLRIENQTGAKV